MLASVAVLADQWRTEEINVNTNRMVLTLGDEYRQPCRFDGFWTAPNPDATYTNVTTLTVTRGQYTWYSLTSYPTNGVLRVSGLDLPVQYGDVVAFTNNYTTGKLYLHFKVE
jgi:hypothetical protein